MINIQIHFRQNPVDVVCILLHFVVWFDLSYDLKLLVCHYLSPRLNCLRAVLNEYFLDLFY